MARCASNVTARMNSSRTWWRASRARSTPWRLANPRSRTCSCTTRAGGWSRRRHEAGPPGLLHAVVARDRPVLAAAQPNRRRAGIAARLLVPHRVRAQSILPGRPGHAAPGGVSRVLLSRHAGAYPVVHRDLFHDFDRRGSAGGVPAGCTGGPVPRAAIVVGKVLGSTTLAVMQGAVFLLLAPFAQVQIHLVDLPALFGVMVLVSFGLSGMGLLVAWWLDSTQGFHAIMNIFLIPLWILSGALFPASGAAGWVRALMLVNPMTYGVSALRRFFYDQPLAAEPPFGLSLAGVVLFAGAMTAAGTVAVRRKG